MHAGRLPVIRDHSNRFYILMGAMMLAVVAAGFAPRYYAGVSSGASGMPLFIHVHALLFYGWLMLFAAQALLVRRGRLHYHRQLGLVGMALAAIIVVVGVYTAIEGARRGHSPGARLFPNAMAFMIVPLTDIVVFAVFVAAAWFARKRRELHKRFMLFATLGAFLWPALTRFPLLPIGPSRPVVLFALFGAVLLAPAIKDLLTRRRVHPVDIGAAALIFASIPLRRVLGLTDAWQHIARWMAG